VIIFPPHLVCSSDRITRQPVAVTCRFRFLLYATLFPQAPNQEEFVFVFSLRTNSPLISPPCMGSHVSSPRSCAVLLRDIVELGNGFALLVPSPVFTWRRPCLNPLALSHRSGCLTNLDARRCPVPVSSLRRCGQQSEVVFIAPPLRQAPEGERYPCPGH